MDEERLLVINGSDMHGDVWIQFPPLVLQVMQKARQVGWAVKTCRVSGRRAHAVHNPVSCARHLLQAGYAASLGVDEAFTCKSPALPGQVDKPGILRTGQETEVSSTPSRFQIFWPLSREHKWSPLGNSANSCLFQPNAGQAVSTEMDFSIHRSRTEQQFSTLWFIRILSRSLKSNNTQALTFSESLLWCSSRMETGCSCDVPKWLDETSSLGATETWSTFHP